MNKVQYIGYRPTWAEIDLGALAYNFNRVKRMLKSRTKVMVTVKADAYGHGLIPVSKKLVRCGVDYLGVASIDEGIKLREAGIKAPVLVLGAILKKDILPLFEYYLTPTICAEELAQALNTKAKVLGRRINAHIKVDTGMGRLGVLLYEAKDVIEKISKLKQIDIEGIFTHFPLADTDREFTFTQIKMFADLVRQLKEMGIQVPFVHAANSMGILGYEEAHFNMVRPGLVIYGLSPKESIGVDLKPVLSLKTRIIHIKKMPKGYGISYGHNYITQDNTQIVILPVGYGDGYPRNLSNKASVLIKGKRFRISGKVCMDQIMVDVGGLPVKTGDEVILIGAQGKDRITSEELARLTDTIPYEIVCGLGSRIPRVYID